MTKYDIIFLASYPNSESIKDGAAQRIHNIDKAFNKQKRLYISISLRHNRKKKIIKQNELITEYKLNLFYHFLLIWKLLRLSNTIYIHSIYAFSQATLHLLFTSKQYLWLDVHGVVPEEVKLRCSKFLYYLYNFIEHIAFKNIYGAIYVTRAMEEHYSKKYSQRKNLNTIIYNIHSNYTFSQPEVKVDENQKTVVIYSGNLQAWQNIDLMLDIISKNLSDQLEYIILTGDYEAFMNKITQFNISPTKLTVKSVAPEMLWKFYSKAHYGFILRDDILVNRVANPTKMIEYLSYGIIPIVKLEQIGDFDKYGYEYISYRDFNTSLKPRKSVKNISIANQITSQKTNLEKAILKQ